MSRKWWIAGLAAGLSFGQQRGIVLGGFDLGRGGEGVAPETVVVIPIGAEPKSTGRT